jgi:hypothetical protein
MAKNECIEEARRALNDFTGEELEKYISQVARRTRELTTEGVPFARDKAIQEINKDHTKILFDECMTAARNIEKYKKLKKKMGDGTTPIALLEKTNKNTAYNVETASNAAKQTLMNDSFQELTKDNMEFLANNENMDSIFAYADGVEHENPMVKEIGEKLKHYIVSRETMLIRTNAMQPSEIRGDRFFKSMYNPSKLSAMGKENFVANMKKFINIEKTFQDTKAVREDGSIDEAVVDKMIGNTYNNIIQGHGVLFTNPTVARDFAKVEKKRHMFYVYKDWRNWGEGNKVFGDNSLLKAWIQDINTSGKQAGMASIFGSAPQMMWNELRKLEVEKIEASGKPMSIKQSVRANEADALFNQLLGTNGAIWSPKLGNIGSSLRSLSSISRLGNLAIKSLSDISQIGAMAQRAGYSFWKSYFDGIVHAFNLMPSEERAILARTMSSSLNVHMGTMARYAESADMGNIMNRMGNKFFHLTAVDAFDQGNKLSAMMPIMKGLGRDSVKQFDELNGQTQYFLKKFDITNQEWDALRGKTEKNWFTTDNVDRLNESEMKDLWNAGEKDVPLSEYRSHVYRKVFGLFDVMQENAVLNPTAYTHMITSFGGTRAGTIGGEAVRMIMQFKGYPLQYMKRVIVGGMGDFDSYGAKFMYALNLSLGTMLLASLSEVLVALGQGLTPPDPSRMSKSEQLRYFTKLLGGGFGIFGKVLDPNSQNKNLFGSFFNTPSIRLGLDPFTSAFALATGNLSQAKSTMKDWANVANPIGTIPGVSPFVDSLLGNKPYMEPGQRQLY